MEHNLNHIICSKFNLQLENKPITYEGNPCWLQERLAMFKKYSIGAFAHQTDPNFHLLLYCDNSTPDPYRSELLELESNYEFITICWDFSKGYGKDWHQVFKSSILNQIKQLVPINTKKIICSRFDSDDIPEIRYNEFVKLAHQGHDIISLAKGLYWDIETNQFLDSIFPSGPFISVKSNLDSFMSPLEDVQHHYVAKRKGTPIITDENLWIQVVHGKNLWNRLDRMPGKLIPPPPQDYLKTYFAYE